MLRHTRSLSLTKLYIISFWNRLKLDLARELTVAICATVLIALFVYMFNDFIQIKISSLDQSVRSIIGQSIAIACFLAASLWLYRVLRLDDREPSGIYIFALRLGETRSNLHQFRLQKTMMLCSILYALTWLLTERFLWSWSWEVMATLQGFALIPVILIYWRRPNLEAAEAKKKSVTVNRVQLNRKMFTPMHWRLNQLLYRNRMAQICLGTALLCSLSTAAGAWMGTPILLSVLVMIFSSSFLVAALAFQLQEDMASSWLDKGMGISHEVIVKTYFRLGLAIGVPVATLSLLGLVPLMATDSWLEWLKLPWIGLVGPVCFAAIMFQIDPRKPFIQMLIGLLLSLFLGTAIFAHWLSLLLIPILFSYGKQYQAGSYYNYI